MTTESENGRKRRGSSRLIQLAEEVIVSLFHDARGIAYAQVEVADHRETWAITSGTFGHLLRRLHYDLTGEGLAEEVLKEATATLQAKARFGGPELEVHRRVATWEGGVVVDLGDAQWRTISVSADGWRVVHKPGVHFVRDKSTLPLPEPTRGGSIEELHRFTNCADQDSWHLLCGALVMCFHPRGPFPVIYITGEQGSAKSTLSRMISSLADPNIAPLVMGTPQVSDLAVVASGIRLLGFDNVSRVSPAFSDALCQLVTGIGHRARELFTDGEQFILDLKTPVQLNAIGHVINRPDLLDRVALVELAPIPPEQRRTEEEFWADWEQSRPRILGAILDGVVAAVANADRLQLDSHPRMADFARWGEAAGRSFGWAPGTFTNALEGSRQDLLEGSADARPEIGALLTFMEAQEDWTGSASDLLKLLSNTAGESTAKSSIWPKRADTLSNRLTQHAPLLRTHGVEINRGREAGGNRQRFLRITRAGDTGTQRDAQS